MFLYPCKSPRTTGFAGKTRPFLKKKWSKFIRNFRDSKSRWLIQCKEELSIALNTTSDLSLRFAAMLEADLRTARAPLVSIIR